QVRAYRGVYERHDKEPDRVSFGDIINAQQILANTITTYVSVLGGAWTAAVDVAGLLQTSDLFQLAEEQCVAPVPALEEIFQLPCCHPCTPLPDPKLKGAEGSWPERPGLIPPAAPAQK